MSSMSISLRLSGFQSDSGTRWLSECNIRVTSGRDKIEEGMDTVVPEARVTLDTRLLGENVVVLAFQVTNDFLEAITDHVKPE